MGLNAEERAQLVSNLHNYVERAYANRQDYREFLDNLIDTYSTSGLDGLSGVDKKAFLELVEEAL